MVLTETLRRSVCEIIHTNNLPLGPARPKCQTALFLGTLGIPEYDFWRIALRSVITHHVERGSPTVYHGQILHPHPTEGTITPFAVLRLHTKCHRVQHPYPEGTNGVEEYVEH